MNILMVNQKCGFTGGVERYIASTTAILEQSGYHVYGLFEEMVSGTEEFVKPFERVFMIDGSAEWESLEIDLAIIHKTDSPELVRRVRRKFRTAVFFHDHDYYCLRRHKYFPLTARNCHLPFNPLYCAFCSGLLEKRGGRISLINLPRKMRLIKEIRQCDNYLVMSEYMQHNLLLNGYERVKISKLYPVSEPDKLIQEDRVAQVVFVGQLIRGKGVDLLLRALARIKQDFRAYIIGRGNDSMRLCALAEQLLLSEKVTFIGWTSEPETYLRQAAVVVVPSRWQEPFGLVGIEAFACRVPVVGFDVGGIGEWLRNEENGILVREGDLDGLHDGIELLLCNPEKAKKYGQAGYDYVRDVFPRENFLSRFRLLIEGRQHV